MKNILIVGALGSEIKEIKKQIKDLNLVNFKIYYLVSGVGNYNIIFNLTKFLSQNSNFDFVINIGVCGYKKEKETFIQIGRIKNLSNLKELIIPNFIEFTSIKSIACSEKIIYSEDEILDENFVDMESYGFEFVLEKFNLPRIILKVPVDKVGEETKNFDFDIAKKLLRENINYKELLIKIGSFIDKNINLDNNLDKYFSILKFTETQRFLFKKLYNKYEVLVGNNFDEYFFNFLNKNKYKIIQKNDIKLFLKNLERYLENK